MTSVAGLARAATAAPRPRQGVCLRLAWAGGAVGLGGLGATALAPLHLAPAWLLGFGGLWVLLERTQSLRGAFALGWLFGLGSFLVGLSWITEAFNVDAARFGPFVLPALLALCGGLAVFPALSVAVARLIAGRAGGLMLAFGHSGRAECSARPSGIAERILEPSRWLELVG